MKDRKPIGRLLCDTNQNLRNHAEKLLAPFDLTGEQYHLLTHVETTVGRSQNALCELVMKSPANLTRILDRLEKKKLILRKKNPDDRRSYLVFRTTVGDALLESVSQLLDDFSRQIERDIPREHLQTAMKVLHQMNRNIQLFPDIHGDQQ